MSALPDALQSLIELSQKTLLDTMKQASSLKDNESDHLSVIKESLDTVKTDLSKMTDRLQSTTKDYFDARARLSQAVRGGSEDEQLRAYELAESFMMEKAALTEEEKHLRSMMKYLQEEERRACATVERSEALASRLRMALGVLNDNIEDAMSSGSDAPSPIAAACSLVEKESRNLARELHDGPAQDFAGAVMSLDYCRRLLELGRAKKAASELDKIRSRMSDIMDKIRSFLFSLYPRDVEDGLGKALVKMGDLVFERHGVPMTVTLFGDCDSVPPVLGVSVYKIIRQAVDNSLASGSPGRIGVVLSCKSGSLSAKIMDDGVGFDVQKADMAAKEQGSYGMASMRERARLAGGTLKIDSVPGQGTVVSLRVPLGGAFGE